MPANSCVDPSGNIGNSPFGVCYFYPSTPHVYGGQVDRNLRDTQHQHRHHHEAAVPAQLLEPSYLRVFGYDLYSNWFIHGPLSRRV